MVKGAVAQRGSATRLGAAGQGLVLFGHSALIIYSCESLCQPDYIYPGMHMGNDSPKNKLSCNEQHATTPFQGTDGLRGELSPSIYQSCPCLATLKSYRMALIPCGLNIACIEPDTPTRVIWEPQVGEAKGGTSHLLGLPNGGKCHR